MSKAYESGVSAGRQWCHDQTHYHDSDVVYEDGINMPGEVQADERLWMSCDDSQLMDILGLNRSQLEARGIPYRMACADYNRGWDAAILAAIASRAHDLA